jgi:hypothetical protein
MQCPAPASKHTHPCTVWPPVGAGHRGSGSDRIELQSLIRASLLMPKCHSSSLLAPFNRCRNQQSHLSSKSAAADEPPAHRLLDMRGVHHPGGFATSLGCERFNSLYNDCNRCKKASWHGGQRDGQPSPEHASAAAETRLTIAVSELNGTWLILFLATVLLPVFVVCSHRCLPRSLSCWAVPSLPACRNHPHAPRTHIAASFPHVSGCMGCQLAVGPM